MAGAGGSTVGRTCAPRAQPHALGLAGLQQRHRTDTWCMRPQPQVKVQQPLQVPLPSFAQSQYFSTLAQQILHASPASPLNDTASAHWRHLTANASDQPCVHAALPPVTRCCPVAVANAPRLQLLRQEATNDWTLALSLRHMVPWLHTPGTVVVCRQLAAMACRCSR